MDTNQKKNLILLVIIGFCYFVLFIFPNASTMGSNNPIVYLHTDEYVTYPIVERMLEFGPDINTSWGRLIIYGDYHYGYPFYFFSMLTLLPLRLIQGSEFFNQTSINILVLRQMISVLPMILTAGTLTYVVTRLQKRSSTIFTFLFILTIPAVVRNNMHWWHPDALMMLAIALTFLFLQLDNGRLKKHFYFAAITCGLASAIKLMGFFFFLTIPLYLYLVWRKEKISIKRIFLSALLFVFVMLSIIVISNPFLFYKGPREEMLAIQAEKSFELTEGYSHEESLYYSLGPRFWRWTLEVSYGEPNFPLLLLTFLIISVITDSKNEMNLLLLSWIIPIGIYFLWFVAPKPDHYLLPLMIPLYATVTTCGTYFKKVWLTEKKWLRWIVLAGAALLIIVIVDQCIFHITRGFEQYIAYFVVL